MAIDVRTQEGDTVDALCWRHLGRTEGIVEATLELNPGLASHGPQLPAGMLVTLATPEAPQRQLLQLWD